MTLQELTQKNEKFQQVATQMAELIPGGNLIAYSTKLIRCSVKLEAQTHKVLAAKGNISFYNQIDLLEDEIDELIFLIDKLDEANRSQKILVVNDVVKSGYEMVSLYSLLCDQVIQRKTQNQDEFQN